jgi:hypothetical protein
LEFLSTILPGFWLEERHQEVLNGGSASAAFRIRKTNDLGHYRAIALEP